MFEARTIDYKLLESFPRHLLARALFAKLLRRVRKSIRGNDYAGYDRAFKYNGLTVFDNRALDGGGWMHGQDFLRGLLSLNLTKQQCVCEWCAGPGYIGFFLLANGFCNELVLVDKNPAAIDMIQRTVTYNCLQDRVRCYLVSDIADIPEEQRWDLVVANPPQYQPRRGSQFDELNIRAVDLGWAAHRQFYKGLKARMRPGGLSFVEESILPQMPGPLARSFKRPPLFKKVSAGDGNLNSHEPDLSALSGVDLAEFPQGSQPDLFRPMIEEGAGRWLGWTPAINQVGDCDGFYYVVAEW